MALCRMLLLVLCASACADEAQQLASGSDEFSVLQTEMSAKAKETVKSTGKLSHPEPPSSSVSCPNMPDMILQDNMCSGAAPGNRKVPAPTSAPTADALKEEVPQSTEAPSESTEAPLLTELPSESAVETGETAAEPPCCLRYMLQLLIIAVFADGLRRSRQQTAAVTEKRTPVDCNSPAAAEGRAEMFKVVHAGDSKACKALLTRGVPVTGEDQSGNTLLHVAVKSGSAEVLKLLLQKGAKVNAIDAWDDTPLHLAARHHQSNAEQLCELLIKYGAKVDALNAQEWTPLVVAGSAGKRAVCEFLLARGATPGDVPEASLPPMLRLLLQGEEPEAPEPEVMEKQSFDVSAM